MGKLSAVKSSYGNVIWSVWIIIPIPALGLPKVCPTARKCTKEEKHTDETDSQQDYSNSTWGLRKMVGAPNMCHYVLSLIGTFGSTCVFGKVQRRIRHGSKCQAQLPHIGHGFCLDQPYFGDLLGTQFCQI